MRLREKMLFMELSHAEEDEHTPIDALKDGNQRLLERIDKASQ